MSLREKFSHLFEPDVIVGEGSVDEEFQDRAERMAQINDAKAFISTDAYKAYRQQLSEEMDSLEPKADLGMDSAAACAFQQKGLRSAVRILDNILAIAGEQE